MRTSPGEVSDKVFERVANQFVDAFNRRDPEAFGAVFHAQCELRPTLLVGFRSVYRGHSGVRRYFDDLADGKREHGVRVREIRRMGPDQFAMLTEVTLGDKVVSPAAAIVRVQDEKVIELAAYLSDEDTLAKLEMIPEPGEPA
jgi:hypothetical protein